MPDTDPPTIKLMAGLSVVCIVHTTHYSTGRALVFQDYQVYCTVWGKGLPRMLSISGLPCMGGRTSKDVLSVIKRHMCL